jgi:hypothetical protein
VRRNSDIGPVLTTVLSSVNPSRTAIVAVGSADVASSGQLPMARAIRHSTPELTIPLTVGSRMIIGVGDAGHAAAIDRSERSNTLGAHSVCRDLAA